mmetsp:Transcript_14943/g.26860  ORF Transcript_14943/g.26860 Transcript_14943/m.26860 type:complete len:294 (-) Transcript_14943:202-1083(-)
MGVKYTEAYGKHKPSCGGVCLLADVGSLNLMPVSAGLIIVPCMVWFIFVAPSLVVLPAGAIAPPLVALTMCLAITWLLLAWATEPGIVPFIPVAEEKDPETDDSVDGETTLKRNPGKKRYMIALNGQCYPLPRFRAKICRETEACVERFDHFCPWVGNVVGIRNHKYFVLFTIHSSAVAAEVFASSMYLGASSKTSDIKPYVRAIALALSSYTAVIMLAVGGLMCYHIDLIAQNVSTNERLKGVYAIRRNPYDKGASQNCHDFWCLPIRPSYISTENKEDDVPLPLLPTSDMC